MSLKGFLTSPITYLAPLTFGMMMLFQNCAPPSAMHKKELSSTDSFEIPMSQVAVHLSHETTGSLSNVELYADDAMHALKSADTSNATMLKIRLAAPQNAGVATYNLELPLGSQKMIVARGLMHNPETQKIETFYGTAFVQSNEALSEVTIKMIALPDAN